MMRLALPLLALATAACAHAQTGPAKPAAPKPSAQGVTAPAERLPTDVRRATIIVRDMEASLKLYRDVIGLRVSIPLFAGGGTRTKPREQTYLHRAAREQPDGVFWATGRGLLVLPGHEELIGLRMRAYAQRGDLAGVRNEWEVYERAIHADPWSSGEPSPITGRIT